MPGVYQVYPKRKKNIFKGLSVTTQLIILNVLFWFIGALIIGLYGKEYIALIPDNIVHGKYLWTFLTSMFMHGGLFHLFVNMLSLFFVGSLIEKILGKKRYIWFYLISGLFAGLLYVVLSYLFKDFTWGVSIFGSVIGPAVGASGALFGVIGLLMILTPNLPVYLMFIPIPIKMKYAAPGMLIVLWLISVAGNVGIGNSAHLGGLVIGLIYGVYLRKRYKKKTNYISKHFS